MILTLLRSSLPFPFMLAHAWLPRQSFRSRMAPPNCGGLAHLALFAAVFAWFVLAASPVSAQTWSTARTRPALYQIVAIDRSGELGWPYGREDVAGDGLTTFLEDEAASDLRTVYADANTERTWLRAYFAALRAPNANLTLFFFLDVDARDATGGPAQGGPLGAGLAEDPTSGGYERALAVRGDGTALGAWVWDVVANGWMPLQLNAGSVRGEAGLARDPLRILALDHAYVQVDVQHAVSGLDAACGARIFVRARFDGGPARSFGDDVREEVACRAPTDELGDPEIVRSISCRADADCPAGGRCREGACLFAYDCEADRDCRSGERCSATQCVRVVDRTCVVSAECDGLVCEAGRCVACSEGGSAACPGGSYCSPNGSCVDADELGDGVGRVQGGAFHCAAGPGDASAVSFGALSLLGLSLALRARIRRRRSARRRAEGEVVP